MPVGMGEQSAGGFQVHHLQQRQQHQRNRPIVEIKELDWLNLSREQARPIRMFDWEFTLQVANVLPSVSAAIALAPQRHVWRLCVALHTGLRFVGSACYFYWHLWREGLEPPSPWYRRLVNVAVAFNVMEALALLTLGMISSMDNKVYSVFAACEYIVVASNIVFHYQAMYDYGDHTLALLTPTDVVSRRSKQQ